MIFGKRRGAVLRVDAIGAAVGAGLVVAAWVLARAPVEASRVKAGELSGEVGSAWETVALMEGELERLRARSRALGAEIERTRVDLKPSHSVNAQIARIAELAEGTELDLSEVRPGEAVRLDTHSERPVAVRGRAPFPAVLDFIRAVEGRFADLGVRSVVVSRGSSGEDRGGLLFELELVWFADRAGE